jgi:hypothetical protein
MIRNGILKGTRTTVAKGGKKTVRQLQVALAGSQGRDLRTVQDTPHAGIDCNPPVGSLVMTLESGSSIRFGISSYDFIPPTASPGEFEIYSSDGSSKKARMKAKANGKLYLASVSNATNLRDSLDQLANAIKTFSSAASQSAITSGGSTAATLAAAIVSLFIPLQASIISAKTEIDYLLDNNP